MSICVAIVEDAARVRQNLVQYLNESAGFRCVGAFGTAEDALREIPNLRPDVVLMDINLPCMSGVECVRELKERNPHLHVVMLTVYDDSDQVFRALEWGASGYLLKRTPPDDILKAIEEVHRGGAPMSSAIARKVVQSFQNRRSPQETENLSPREEEILSLVAKGFSNKEIADALHIGFETVRSHLKSIYEKLHVRSRTAAAVKYFR